MPTIKEALLGTEEQNKVAQANLDKQASQGSSLAKMLGGNPAPKQPETSTEKKKAGGTVKSSASKRADGIAQKGHTKGKYL